MFINRCSNNMHNLKKIYNWLKYQKKKTKNIY